jgi:hypothetical protein
VGGEPPFITFTITSKVAVYAPAERADTLTLFSSLVKICTLWSYIYRGTSNGKSSIVEERLYSFFFVFFQQKNEASFFRFSSLTQLGTKTFVLLRSCKIVKRFTSLCFVFTNFWNNPICFTFDFEKVGLIPFASLCSSKILEQLGRFFFDLQKFRNKQFVLLSILLYFGLNSFSLRS